MSGEQAALLSERETLTYRDPRSSGVAQAQQLGDLVVGLARRIVQFPHHAPL